MVPWTPIYRLGARLAMDTWHHSWQSECAGSICHCIRNHTYRLHVVVCTSLTVFEHDQNLTTDQTTTLHPY